MRILSIKRDNKKILKTLTKMEVTFLKLNIVLQSFVAVLFILLYFIIKEYLAIVAFIATIASLIISIRGLKAIKKENKYDIDK